MQLQIGRAAEQFLTYVASKRLLSVRPNMVLEIRFPGKPLLADAAWVRLLSRMRLSFVLPQVGNVREPLRANFALVRFFSGVDSQMLLQSGGLIETLWTNVATKRLFARVNKHVTIEVAHLAESLCADVALEVAGLALRRRIAD